MLSHHFMVMTYYGIQTSNMRAHVETKTIIQLESKRIELCPPKKLKSFEKEEACRFFDIFHRLG